VLVRPDNFIVWRARTSADASATLVDLVGRPLGPGRKRRRRIGDANIR